MATPATHIEVTDDQGIRYSLPPDLNCISTYVLLEQRRWFEKEVDFICRFAAPGMTAIDIGANIGIYTLPLAKRVGPLGKVIAYEPGSINRQHLNRALELNQCRNVLVSAAALSDFSGPGTLQLAGSGELNQLVAESAPSKNVEPVAVSTLDAEFSDPALARLDFIKIDAEGQEAAIIRGGRKLLETHSPLIMFEVKRGPSTDVGLVALFESEGFDCYRLLGDGSMLVPVAAADRLDEFELNLFAARPDRALQLVAAGLLAMPGAPLALDPAQRAEAIAHYCAMPFAQLLDIGIDDVKACTCAEPLIAYAAYRFLPGLSPDKRLACLQFAYDSLVELNRAASTSSTLSTLSRVAFDFGARVDATLALNRLLDAGTLDLVEPFFSPSPRHEQIDDRSAAEWFADAVIESRERWNAWSTIFRHDMSRLEWLVQRRNASDDMARRLLLVRARRGMLNDERPTIQTDSGCFGIPHDPDWLALVRSLAKEA